MLIQQQSFLELIVWQAERVPLTFCRHIIEKFAARVSSRFPLPSLVCCCYVLAAGLLTLGKRWAT